ncbi:MAG: phosphoglycerate dehydrogenase [Limisphaerales bacterium]
MSWKVLFTTPALMKFGDAAEQLLAGAGCELVNAVEGHPHCAEEMRGLVAGCDAVLAGLDQYSAAVIRSEEAAGVKIISRRGVGFDRVDVSAATEAGIAVGFTPGVLDGAVGDYTWAMLLALARGVHRGHRVIGNGEWQLCWGQDVHGKTLGIIGCGRIGQAVAKRATGFDMTVLGHDVAPSPQAEALGVQFVELDELLERSDFVSLNCALTPETTGLINAERLHQMKSNALLINTARGAIVDEAALEGALREERIGGAALDAFCVEPLPVDHPLRSCPNLLLTPHQAPCGKETAERLSLAAARNIVDLCQGRKPSTVVNPEVWESPALRALLK